MNPGRLRILKTLGIAVLATALFTAGAARADAYADVGQLLRAGELAQALARADRHLAQHPRDPQMRFLRGVLLTETGRTDEAMEAFETLTQDYPELPEPYNNLAVLHAGRGQFDHARLLLETAVRVDPGYATAHENLGDVYAQLAGRQYGRALALAPASPSARAKLALVRQLFAPAAGAAAGLGPASAAGAAGGAAETPAARPAPAR